MAGHPVKVSLLTAISRNPLPKVFPANGLTDFILCVFLCVHRVLVVIFYHKGHNGRKECDTGNCNRKRVMNRRTLSLVLVWVRKI